MSEITTIDVTLTPDIVRGEILLALTAAEQSIQLLHNAKAKLILNEDNLVTIKEFLDNCDKSAKIVETQRKEKKQPHWDNCTAVDAGAKILSSELDLLKKDVNATYQKLCRDADEKKRKAKEDEDRIFGIRQNMSNFKVDMASKVAAEESYAGLVALERLMNLETANKSRYAEFQEEFKNDVKDLSGLISAKKIAAREREGLGLDGQDGAENKPDEEILADMDRKEVLDTKIAELNTKVVETAVNQASRPTGSATQIFTTVPKGGRKLWQYEVVDLKAAEKAGLTLTVIDESKVKAILADKREAEEECTENGIRYFQIKKY